MIYLGVCTKTQKTIGIRHSCCWYQLTFRYKWEFDKFLYDSKCYGLTDEHSSLVVTKYEDLQTSDYILLNVHTWDQYNVPDEDGGYSGSYRLNAKDKPGGGRGGAEVRVRSKKSKRGSGGASSSTSWW